MNVKPESCRRPWLAGTLALGLVGLVIGGAGCGRGDREPQSLETSPAVQGRPIRALALASNAPGPTSPTASTASTTPGPTNLTSPTEIVVDGFLQLGFDRLSGFVYRVYEYYAEGVSGRPLLKSDDVIPDTIRALDGRQVSVRGFVLPLRTRQGRVSEFLLLRDQGTCCFGPQAQINHFIRVNFPKGRALDQTLPYRASGRLRVGETYVQGYLTGIYALEASAVEEAR